MHKHANERSSIQPMSCSEGIHSRAPRNLVVVAVVPVPFIVISSLFRLPAALVLVRSWSWLLSRLSLPSVVPGISSLGVVYRSPGSRNVISIRPGGATSWPRRSLWFPVVVVPVAVVSVGLGLNSSSVERNIVRRGKKEKKCVYEAKKNSPGFHPEHLHIFQ